MLNSTGVIILSNFVYLYYIFKLLIIKLFVKTSNIILIFNYPLINTDSAFNSYLNL